MWKWICPKSSFIQKRLPLRTVTLPSLALLTLAVLNLTLPAGAAPNPCSLDLERDSQMSQRVAAEGFATVIAHGIGLHGELTTLEKPAVDAWRLPKDGGDDPPHEVDPDPLTVGPVTPPWAPTTWTLLWVEAVDATGEPLPSARVTLYAVDIAHPRKNDPEPDDEEPPHEVDPDPLTTDAPERLWRACVRIADRAPLSMGFQVAGDPTDWHESYLSWVSAWAWPEAFKGEAERPHHNRFRLIRFGD